MKISVKVNKITKTQFCLIKIIFTSQKLKLPDQISKTNREIKEKGILKKIL